MYTGVYLTFTKGGKIQKTADHIKEIKSPPDIFVVFLTASEV